MSKRLAAAAAVLVLACGSAWSATLRNGVLTVGGRPFYPLASWNSTYTRPQEIARLGMNTCYWISADAKPAAVASYRKRMRECAALGLQFIAYVTPGTPKVGWSDAEVRSFATLTREPNLLAWYVGDDITAPQLPAMEATASRLQRYAPGIPRVADFIGTLSPEAAKTYRHFLDIRSCYDYPVPEMEIAKYMALFDKHRAFAGDPMWTWIQNFMWGSTASRLNLGNEGAGPLPDPEQVRLVAHAAINRGVRGLLFFAHNQLHRLPEVAAEVSLTCREVGMFNDELAAGKLRMNLRTSSGVLNAASFTTPGATVVSAMLVGPTYHRWIDRAIVRNAWIECPWSRGAPLPSAVVAATPDVRACRVARVPGKDAVRITMPMLELCGFVLVTADRGRIGRLETQMRTAVTRLAGLAAGAAAAQTRKVAGAMWQSGFVDGDPEDTSLIAARYADACGDAVAAGRAHEAVRNWRLALRNSRKVLEEIMGAVEVRKANVPSNLRYLLESPYSLHNVPGIGQAPRADEPWRYITRWQVAGPFTLDYGGDPLCPPTPGFTRAYGPEIAAEQGGPFQTVDGTQPWQAATCGISGMLNLRRCFATTAGVVAYARATVTAPADMPTTISLGSNDGCILLVNGEEVFRFWGGRGARQHQDRVTVHLRRGANTILAKVANFGGEWQLYLALEDARKALTFGAE